MHYNIPYQLPFILVNMLLKFLDKMDGTARMLSKDQMSTVKREDQTAQRLRKKRHKVSGLQWFRAPDK